MNKDINLIRAKSQNPLTRLFDKIVLIRVLAVSLLSLVAAVSLAFFLLVAFSPLPQLQQEEKTKKTQIQLLHRRMGVVLGTQERLTAISSLLNTRSDIGKLMEQMDAKLPEDVVLSGFTVEDGLAKIKFTSSSIFSLEQAIKQISIPPDKNIKQIILDQISLDASGAEYIGSVTMVLK